MKFSNCKDFFKTRRAENSGCPRFVLLNLWNTRLFQMFIGSIWGCRWNLLVDLKDLRWCYFDRLPFSDSFQHLTVALHTCPQQNRRDDVKVSPPSSWSVGVGVPAGTRGRSISHPGDWPNEQTAPVCPRGWLQYCSTALPSSIRTGISLYYYFFLFYLEWGVCFCLQECFALQGVFPLKNRQPKRSVEKKPSHEILNFCWKQTPSAAEKQNGKKKIFVCSGRTWDFS